MIQFFQPRIPHSGLRVHLQGNGSEAGLGRLPPLLTEDQTATWWLPQALQNLPALRALG